MSSISDEFEDFLIDDKLFDWKSIEDEFNSEENKSKTNNIENDRKIALQLHSELNVIQNDENSKELNIVSPDLETLDPNPNIWQLMIQFDKQFFNGILSKHCIELSWSSRMTRTAGLCAWNPVTNYCSIRLSLPLLQLRTRKDLVETLIHEMIHSLLFVTRKDDNHESHGPLFHEHMYRINRESGTNITVYHDFYEEVNHYLKHIWRCNGKCQKRKPYYGYVRRAINRKPGPYDYWFKYHEQTCGGTFIKISEPLKEDSKMSKKIIEILTPEKLQNHDIRSYLSPKKQLSETTSSAPKIVPFSGFGTKLGSNKPNNNTISSKKPNSKPNSFNTDNDNDRDFKSKRTENKKKVSPLLKSGSVSNTITNSIKNHFIPTIRTISSSNSSEERVVLQNDKMSSTFIPFSGRGNVLGSIKCENNSLKRTNASDSMTSSVIKKPKKINIEVIELD